MRCRGGRRWFRKLSNSIRPLPNAIHSADLLQLDSADEGAYGRIGLKYSLDGGDATETWRREEPVAEAPEEDAISEDGEAS